MEIRKRPSTGVFGQCKCCLRETHLKNMWDPLETQGNVEVFGQMLIDCFGISWSIDNMDDDNLCQLCISKIRVGVAFKKQILESQAALTPKGVALEVETLADDDWISETEEIIEEALSVNQDITDTSQLEQPEVTNTSPVKRRDYCKIAEKRRNTVAKILKKEDNIIPNKFNKIEDDTLNIEDHTAETNVSSAKIKEKTVATAKRPNTKTKSETDNNYDEILDTARKRRRKQDTAAIVKSECLSDNNVDGSESERINEDVVFLEEVYNKNDEEPAIQTTKGKIKKQYTEEELSKAIEAVKSNKMSQRQAAEAYNVPKKTINGRIYLRLEEDDKKDMFNMREFFKVIRSILTHTNATPFKIKSLQKGYSCFFCPANGVFYKDPVELRHHTNTVHKDQVRQIELVMRPHYLYQMVRFDVYNLTCNCEEDVKYTEILEHLEAKHGLSNIENSRKKIVFYDLRLGNITCTFKSCNFTGTFNDMDAHMNVHFQNFLCNDCGKPFVTIARLKAHEYYHKFGIFPCKECDAVFKTKKQIRSHVDRIHKKKLILKCSLCPERFATDQMRLKHMNVEHKDMLSAKGKYCDLCEKHFWVRDFWIHMKSKHKQFQCSKCGSSFGNQKLLGKHKCNENEFECDVCSKIFLTAKAARVHQKNECSNND